MAFCERAQLLVRAAVVLDAPPGSPEGSGLSAVMTAPLGTGLLVVFPVFGRITLNLGSTASHG